MQRSKRLVGKLGAGFDKKEALVAAHRWAGAAGSIGYPEITRTARELEVALQQSGSGSRKRTRELLVRVSQLFAEAVESNPQEPAPRFIETSSTPHKQDAGYAEGKRA
jgi:HPt (histidine-containing phosphotransfer) domain-containing protein